MSPKLPTDPVRSALMGRVRQKGTKPELVVAAALKRLGLSYRKNARDIPGSPDFVNRARRWAVFVNGCYWHHHSCCCGTIPTRNREFWLDKFRTNRSRDARSVRLLRAAGYKVVLIWECESRDPERLGAKLRPLVGRLGIRPRIRRNGSGNGRPRSHEPPDLRGRPGLPD